MYFRQFVSDRNLGFIIWKNVRGKMDNGYCKGYGNGWQFTNNRNKQTFKLELIL